ncbi:hypothetical protein Acr_23g0009730 [Actinidia rufa]|uniref:CCHC-type domain-containing protein n=1 Tax=Actinidia rufa TaxID=165716 RepID=A0A7J0GPB7_9ERIC|nr:hypothetical protein Acr_23g0009730 [Actinidia rufa]
MTLTKSEIETGFDTVSGFGFDERSGRSKVIRILYVTVMDPVTRIVSFRLEGEICTIGSGEWRNVFMPDVAIDETIKRQNRDLSYGTWDTALYPNPTQLSVSACNDNNVIHVTTLMDPFAIYFYYCEQLTETEHPDGDSRAGRNSSWIDLPFRIRCSSHRYGAPSPNRVRNRVRTRPHAPFEDRRVRSVSTTRQRVTHALPCAQEGSHAPGKAYTRQHAPGKRLHVQPRARRSAHALSRVEQTPSRALTRGEGGVHVRLTRQAEARAREAPRGATCAPKVLKKDGGGHMREFALLGAFYCDQKGHIKRDCPKCKAQDQSLDTAATAVMAVDESEVLLAASDDGNEGILRIFKGNKDMLWGKKTGGLYRLEGSVQTGGATIRHGSSGISEKSGHGKQLLHRGTQSKRRGTWGSVMVPRGSRVRSSEERDQVNFEKLYSEGRSDAEASLFCSRFDQWRCSLQLCAQGRRDGATTTRKVTYFAAHSVGVCGAPQWGGAGHLGEKVQALRCGGAYTSVESGVAR